MAALDLDNDLLISLTGASSDGGAQTSPALALGNFRSATAFVNDSDQNTFPIIDASDALAGITQYLILNFRNDNGGGSPDADALNFKFYMYEANTTTLSATYAASGATTATLTSTTGHNTQCGYLINDTTGEIMFHTGISGSVATILAAHRGLRGGAGETAGSITDVIRPYPWCDIACETNTANKTAGACQTIGSITTAPTLSSDTDGAWSVPLYATKELGYAGSTCDINHNSFGTSLLDGYMCYLLLKFIVPAGTVRNTSADIWTIRGTCQN